MKFFASLFFVLLILPNLAIGYEEIEAKSFTSYQDDYRKLDYHSFSYDYRSADDFLSNPTSYSYELGGLYEVLWGELEGQFNSFYRRHINQIYNDSNDHQFSFGEYRNELEELSIPTVSSNLRWYHYLPPEKGGMQKHKIKFGKTIKLFSLFGVELFSNGKLNLKKYRIIIDNEQQFEKLEDSLRARNINEPERNGLNFAIVDNDYSFMNNELWQINIKPAINIQATETQWEEIINSMSVKFVINLLMNRKIWSTVEMIARFRPINQDFGILFAWSLINF